ncbi:MAG: amino acid permease [Desulfosarcinaceae bacterium]|nr:amino acid permease [Desulfosarcinaceae bacterium]
MANSAAQPPHTALPQTGTLGTFAGVFTPSILTILGIILFLRLGYVVGAAGLRRALIIIALANVISILTSVSLAAIATNLKVKGGGDYYLISRTLGPGFGGALGLVLFLAQSVSIGFYAIGFGEALSALMPHIAWLAPRTIAVAAVLLLFIFAWLGADWATRFQFGVMAILTGALIVFFAGGLPRWDSARLAANWSAPDGAPAFFVLFAIFFPAVTGFTQGVSMSGDLRDPGKSLPLGTFVAVAVSILVYFGVALVFAAALPNTELAGDYGAMKRVALWGPLIDAGVVAATLSSAMASFLGAPRILQSLASDRIFKGLTPFAQGAGPANNPRRGVLLSGAIALTTISLGQLNTIAQVVSMFFLISYGLLNYATYFEVRSASPSFRPRFRWFHPTASLAGFLVCGATMLAIDAATGIAAMAILLALYQYVLRTAGPARWADSRRSHYLQRAREHLIAAAAEPQHDRDWRPVILAFTHDRHRRPRLLRFCHWIAGQSGLTAAVEIVEGEGARARKDRDAAAATLRSDVKALGLPTFSLAIRTPEIGTALPYLVQSFGLGPLTANTICLNWVEQLGRGIPGLGSLKYAQNLRTVFRLGCNLVILSGDADRWQRLAETPESDKRIDVWWWGDADASSRLMLLFAYLLTRHHSWSDAPIRLLAADRSGPPDAARRSLTDMLEEVRIDARPVTVEGADAETIRDTSKNAAMVFMPFRIQGLRLTDPFGGSLERLLPHLPITALVKAAEEIDLDAAPEEGTAGAAAQARDTYDALVRRANERAAAADQDKRRVAALTTRLAESDLVEADRKALEAEIATATAAAEQSRRRAAKAQAKAEAAAAALPDDDAPEEGLE